MQKSDAPICPKCRTRRMHRNGHTGSGKVRWQCRDTDGRACYTTTNPEAEARRQDGRTAKAGGEARRVRGGFEVMEEQRFARKLKEKTKVFVITAAQNATPVDRDAWPALLQLVEHRNAELLAIPIRYKNPTSQWTASQANAEKWAKEVTPYLWNVRKALNSKITVLADVKTQPTASDPIAGYDAMTGASSAILGHTKLQLRSIATPSSRMAKIMTTSGAITVQNYTDSKTGKLGSFHHTIGAVIVEVVNRKRFHLRHVTFDRQSKSFIDLDTKYTANKVEKAPRPLALIMGDTHVDFISKSVERATFGKGGMIDTLKPRHVVYHDLLDAYSCNPHHKGNPFVAYAKSISGRGDVQAEVRRACEFVRQRTTGDIVSVIVPANHDDMLTRWIVSDDWKTSGKNMLFYLKTAARMLETTSMTERGTEFTPALPLVFPDFVDMTNIRVLKIDEPFSIANIELGMHGDRGPDGARGSIRNLRRIGIRSVFGHRHSAGIDEGATQVGTSTELSAEYTRGPSSWTNTHCWIHANGKRQLNFIIDGTWRA